MARRYSYQGEGGTILDKARTKVLDFRVQSNASLVDAISSLPGTKAVTGILSGQREMLEERRAKIADKIAGVTGGGTPPVSTGLGLRQKIEGWEPGTLIKKFTGAAREKTGLAKPPAQQSPGELRAAKQRLIKKAQAEAAAAIAPWRRRTAAVGHRRWEGEEPLTRKKSETQIQGWAADPRILGLATGIAPSPPPAPLTRRKSEPDTKQFAASVLGGTGGAAGLGPKSPEQLKAFVAKQIGGPSW